MSKQDDFDYKRRSLIQSIHEAARAIAESYYECNIDNASSEKKLQDGRVSPVWLDDGYCDQVSESLYGDSQACDIIPEEGIFSKSEYEGPYGSGNMWNLLERYLDTGEVDDIFYEEWNELLTEKYGDNWSELK